MTLEFNDKTKAELERICERYPDRQAALLPALRLLEREFGEINERGMIHVAKLIGVPPAHVFGVFTFYTHYRRPGEGKNIVNVCSTLPCALRGSDAVFDKLSDHLGLRHDETSDDGMFTLKKVECLGNCDHGATVQINEDYVDDLTPESAVDLIEKLKKGEKVPEQKYSLPKHKYEPVLLANVLDDKAKTLHHYQQRGGYEAAKKALAMKPEDVIETVKASGLRGRGGAGFPCGMKWGFTDHKSGKPVYLVCNADESEPGTFKDKMLMERDPHLLIEGILISAFAIKSHHCYIYIRGEFGLGAEILQKAVDEAYGAKLLGNNAMGSGWKLDVTVHRGAGAYICGEETGLLSSLEGKRGYPKIKPPFPAVEGAWRCPTIVNNVETLCCVPWIIREGPEGFRKYGTERSPGTKIVCVSGHVERPGNYEIPLGLPLKELIYDLCGGIPNGKKLKAVVPGGSSAKILRHDEIDRMTVTTKDPKTREEKTETITVTLDFDELKKCDTMLGSGGVIVMDESVCIVNALWNVLRFYHHESCGQCTPCREGTGWLERMVARIEKGGGEEKDLELIDELAGDMCGRTICVLADAAAWPAQSYIKKFRDEFVEHIKLGRCPFKEAPVAAKS